MHITENTFLSRKLSNYSQMLTEFWSLIHHWCKMNEWMNELILEVIILVSDQAQHMTAKDIVSEIQSSVWTTEHLKTSHYTKLYLYLNTKIIIIILIIHTKLKTNIKPI